MTYNRSEILKAAWADAKNVFTFLGYARHQLRSLFAAALRKAWAKAKEAARTAARSVESIRAQIVAMENADRLGWDGMQKLSALRTVLAEAKAREAAQRPALARAA
ncbi:hypothetical protein QKW60_08255 [Defluviimonas aestuarii]|uniref:hypothetical protein n=1 Tax=Albidovulum aestuarii TaxID=1130726 RepID=UPI00249C59D2|nr:hypothetical protein [Defluviimonas aestuarii]MDI3336394.1 hypothetical protein [Defluviimonas aestuarii]